MDSEVTEKEQTDLLQLALANLNEVDHDMDNFDSAQVAELQIQMDIALSLRRIAKVLEYMETQL